ncbi:MAG: phenylacetate--CoA ligase [Planctomycetaceae bacterium]|jgi:phenylacetate-CoA ligase|nr:phenylacetate--CoA ligase [Planctomycetaceae bacterium]
MRCFNYFSETMSRDELTHYQNLRLRETVHWAWAQNGFFRKRYTEAGLLRLHDFCNAGDLVHLPFTTKNDFRETYPLGMCCVERRLLREMHMSSGSTGVAVVMPYTASDIEQWGECMARCYVMAGAAEGDAVQITPSFGLFNGGFGMYHGAQTAGLFVVPTGSGNTARQVKLAKDFGTKILCGVVSYAVRIYEVMCELGIELPDLKVGIFGAESFSEGMRQRIESQLGIEAFDIYGMTETGGVGTLGMDCCEHNGIHVWEDHYHIEIIDSATGKSLPDGEQGELVVTSLSRQAIPVIRFKTGDLTKIISREKCACGRTHVRIAKIAGRTDDMLIVKGVNFFPQQVEDALMEIPGVLPQYQIIIEEIDGVREVRINVEADESVTGYMIEKHLKERLGFSPKGDIFKSGELPRFEGGKSKRVIYKTSEK